VTIIFPALGTGFIITIESWIAAYRDRRLMNIGLAAYNTFAQIHNTMGAINTIGPAFQAVGKMFASVAVGRGDAKGKVAILGVTIAIAVVGISLCAGAILTTVLIHRYAGTVPLPAAASAPSARTA
jgi:disulfide bond formation protein DsbB